MDSMFFNICGIIICIIIISVILYIINNFINGG